MPERLQTKSEAEADLDKRLHALEVLFAEAQRQQKERLNNGAETISAHTRHLAALDKRLGEIDVELAKRPLKSTTPPHSHPALKPESKLRIYTFWIGIAVMVAGWIWQGAKYPDRSEYSALQSRIDGLDDQVDIQLERIRDAQVETDTKTTLLGRDVARIEEALRRLEKEIDQLQRRRR